MRIRFLKILGVCLGVLLALFVSAIALINTDYVQNKLVAHVVTVLSGKLHTRVSLERLNFDLFRQDLHLYGLYIEDREQRPLLAVERLTADIDLFALWHHEFRIPEVLIEGVQASFHKPSRDSVANYQFLIDAFKKDTLAVTPAQKPEGSRRQLTFDINRFTAKRLGLSFNERQFSLGALRYVQVKPDSLGEPMRHLIIDNLYFKNEHHRPRKNAQKPHRGFFDPQYLEVTAQLKADIDYLHKDSLHAVLSECFVKDSVTGLDIRDFHAVISATPQMLQLNDVVVRQVDTEVRIDSCELQIPDKHTGRPLAYRTSWIHGDVILQDIARPFAPALKDFTLPLSLSARMQGDTARMDFTDVEVSTPDHRLLVRANGFILDFLQKHDLRVHFDVTKMFAKSGEVERIIRQFPVKRFFMEQLHELGTITYLGAVDVFYKREVFQGTLGTQKGPLHVNLTLDDKNKYLQGRVSTAGFRLGKVLDLNAVGDVSLSADFKFDISKVRTAVMRHRKGGKLPIGEVMAHVTQASYSIVKTQNLQAHIVSDGAIAQGDLLLPGGHMDILCSFSFTETQQLKKMKIKPGVKFHAKSKKSKQGK